MIRVKPAQRKAVERAIRENWPTQSMRSELWHPDDVKAYEDAGGWGAGARAVEEARKQRILDAVCRSLVDGTPELDTNDLLRLAMGARMALTSDEPVTPGEVLTAIDVLDELVAVLEGTDE